jgi:hypothetical protein
MTFIWFKIKFNRFEFRSYCFISSTFHLFIDSYYFFLNMPRKTRHLINTTSKLQVAPNFTLDSVADSNYLGKCDVGGFLIFEWTLHIYLFNKFQFCHHYLQFKHWKLDDVCFAKKKKTIFHFFMLSYIYGLFFN